MSAILTKEQLQAMMARGLTQEQAWTELGISRSVMRGALRRLQMRWVKTATRCRHGHDRRIHSYTDSNGQRRCWLCAKTPKLKTQRKAADERPSKPPKPEMTGGQVLEKLTYDAAMENAPPWVRHPQPWT